MWVRTEAASLQTWRKLWLSGSMNSNKEDAITLDFAVPGPTEYSFPRATNLSKLPNVLHLGPHTVRTAPRACELVRLRVYGALD